MSATAEQLAVGFGRVLRGLGLRVRMERDEEVVFRSAVRAKAEEPAPAPPKNP